MDSRNDALLTREQVCHALCIGRDTLRRLIAARRFPDAMEISPGVWRWSQRDVDAYIYLKGRIGGHPPDRKRKRKKKRAGDSNGGQPGAASAEEK